MWQAIPTIGTILALAAFFFALYFRAVQKYISIAIDSVRSIGALPSKSRLDATKILVNVFDLDVSNLSPEQQFELAKRTFEKRERDSRRNFYLLLISSLILLCFATIYSIANANGSSMVIAALTVDRSSAIDALKEEDFFHKKDVDLVGELAGDVTMPKIDDPIQRVSEFSKKLAAQPAVVDLRARASRNAPPFEVVGEVLKATVPSRANQPRRFRVYVNNNSPYKGKVIFVSAKDSATTLSLFAEPNLGSASTTDLHLNHEQFFELFGVASDNKGMATIVMESSISQVVDPTCPIFRNFPATDCELADQLPYQEIPK